MIVYGELLFAENMIIGGVILYLTGEICGKTPPKSARAYPKRECVRSKKSIIKRARGNVPFWDKLRLVSGSVMCGIFSLAIFLDAKPLYMLLMEIVFAFAVCTVTFGLWRKRGADGLRVIVKYMLTFILTTYFMGGITMGLLLMTENRGIHGASGIYTGDMKAALLALFVLTGTVTVKKVIKTVRRSKLYGEHSFELRIHCNGNTICALGFIDTGNHLREPLSGRPVAVAADDLWLRMLENGFMTEERYAIVPYETVGGRGAMEAVRVDRIEISASEGGPDRRITGIFISKGDGSLSLGKWGQDNAERHFELLLPAETLSL